MEELEIVDDSIRPIEMESDYLYHDLEFQTALEWSLLLNALAINHLLVSMENGFWQLQIDLELVDKATTEIELYEIQKRAHANKSQPITYFQADYKLILLFCFALLAMHIFVNSPNNEYLYQKGELSVKAVLNGEWQRVITALTLHADFAHLLMNLFFGFTFLSILSYLTKTPFAIALTILSGIYGNMLNVLIQNSHHRSIGFSTAVFGTLGAIVGMQVFGKYALKDRSLKILFISAVLFFTLLGVGDEKVDVGAHLCGMVSGLTIGLITSFCDLVLYKDYKSFQNISFVFTILLLFVSWFV